MSSLTYCLLRVPMMSASAVNSLSTNSASSQTSSAGQLTLPGMALASIPIRAHTSRGSMSAPLQLSRCPASKPRADHPKKRVEKIPPGHRRHLGPGTYASVLPSSPRSPAVLAVMPQRRCTIAEGGHVRGFCECSCADAAI